MSTNTSGSNFGTLHPENQSVRVLFINDEGLTNYCIYLGAAAYLPTEAIFEKGCKLVHKAEGKDYINQAADGATPNFVEVPNQ